MTGCRNKLNYWAVTVNLLPVEERVNVYLLICNGINLKFKKKVIENDNTKTRNLK